MIRNCSVSAQKKLFDLLVAKKLRLKTIDQVQSLFIANGGYTIGEVISGSDIELGNKILMQLRRKEGFSEDLYTDEKIKKVKKLNNDINSSFRSTRVVDLFYTLHSAKKYFDQKSKEKLFNNIYLGRPEDTTHVSTQKQLNKNIKGLKNDLYVEIVEFLDNKGLLKNREQFFKKDNVISLYSNNGDFNSEMYINYTLAIELLDKYFFSGTGGKYLIETYSGKKVPNLKGDTRLKSVRDELNVYNAGVFLVNFDNIVVNTYNNVLTMDYTTFNNFEDSKVSKKDYKYKLTTTGLLAKYWAEDIHSSQGVHVVADDLTKNIISIIPQLDSQGADMGMFLEIKDFYSLASLIHTFELENSFVLSNDDTYKTFGSDPQAGLKWFITNIKKAAEEGFEGDYDIYNDFRNRLGLINSIDYFLNSIKDKEENTVEGISISSLLTQVINNTHGAVYITNNNNTHKTEYLEMHSHNSVRVMYQNSIYTHLLLNSTTEDYFYVKDQNGKKLTAARSVKYLQENAENPKVLGAIIRNALGLYLPEESIIRLQNNWKKATKEKGKPDMPHNIESIFKAIRTGDLLEKIIENEKNIEEKFFDESASKSETINDLTTNSAVQSILDVILESEVIKPLTTINTMSGEALPTFKVANLTYNDVEVLQTRRLIEKENTEVGRGSYKSMFLTGKMLLGTVTKLESVNARENKAAASWNVLESFTSNFRYDFLNAYRTDSQSSGINVMIGNYSDKSTVLSKIININAINTDNGKKIIGNALRTSVVTTPERVLEVINEGNTRENKARLNKIFEEFEALELFDKSINILADSNKIIEAKIKAIKEYYGNPSVMTSVEVLKLMRKQGANYYNSLFDSLFEQYEKIGFLTGKEETFKDKVNKINKELSKFKTIDSLLKHISPLAIADNSINFTKELHYSQYTNGIRLNQTLINYHKVFMNQDIFLDYIKDQEDSFIKKLEKLNPGNILFTTEDVTNFNTKKLEGQLSNIITRLGIDLISYNKKFVKKGQHLVEVNNEINPLIKKWLAINGLFRNEYLNITFKGEYMHPQKGFEYKNQTNSIGIIKSLAKESSVRMAVMAKRNVVFTATIELPTRKTRKGIPENLNIAILEDYIAQVHNIVGDRKDDLEIHDGSSIMSYAYSKMVEESYPGKSYKGTKKQFGTFITEFGSAIKKDAEIVLTNDRIRNSSRSVVRGRDRQKQSLSINFNDLNIDIDKKSLNHIFYKDGSYYRMSKYSITKKKNTHTLTIKSNRWDGEKFLVDSVITDYNVKNLYEIWEHFGAEHSAKETPDGFKFDESSNDLLYDLITNFEQKNEIGEKQYPLKDKLIHILSNHTAFKSGVVNLNPRSSWESARSLSYTTVENRHFGPQLDAGHSADESTIKEVTQIISALAQNENTAHIANKVYADLAKIIEGNLNKYEKHLKNLGPDGIAKLSQLLSDKFFDTIQNSENVSLAKTLSATFTEELIPFSNQNFFQLFVRDMITTMNNDFITREYAGIGAVLNPSHGMIQMFERADGNLYSQEDIQKRAFAAHDGSVRPNDQIVQNYINNEFPNVPINIGLIEPGDTVRIGDKTVTLDTIEAYYKFKRSYRGQTIMKINSKPRDLKPVVITFTATEKGSLIKQSYNLYDLPSTRLRFLLDDLVNKRKISSDESAEYNKELVTLEAFIEYFKKPMEAYKSAITDADEKLGKLTKLDENDYKTITTFLNAWTQRNTDLLSDGKVLRNIIDVDISFADYFKDDNLLNDIYSDVKENYTDQNTLIIEDYKLKKAELVLPNIYKSKFKNGEDTIAEIRTKKSTYFKEKFKDDFEKFDKDNQYDMRINLGDGENPVYIKFVNSLPLPAMSEREDYSNDDEGRHIISGKHIKELYNLPKSSVFKTDGNVDYVWVKVSFATEVETINKKEVTRYIVGSGFNSEFRSFMNSFGPNITSVIPLMNNNLNFVNRRGQNYDLNQRIFREFKRFSGYTSNKVISDYTKWFDENKEDVLEQTSRKKYASWQKSQEFIVARIPSQSMQSFMPMKNVAYLNTDSNDAYVSVWQIWIQGSDFDIDKAYIMGYGFDNNAQYENWSELSNYSTIEQLNVLEQFPLPTNKITKLSDTGVLLTKEFAQFKELAKDLNIEGENFTVKQLEFFRDVLTKIEDNGPNVNIVSEDTELIESFITLINKHTSGKRHLYSKNAIKNAVVSKMHKIISMPNNNILSNTPVKIKMWHDGAAKAEKKYGKSDYIISPYNMLSMFKQQQDAIIGKEDVGIGANGLKVYFALTNYYNSWLSKKNYNKEGDIRLSPKSFHKKVIVNDKEYNIHTISDTRTSREYLAKIKAEYGYDGLTKELNVLNSKAALTMSGFVSGATDNAKELVMAKINAITDLANMHLYMASLGFTADDIAVYMRSEIPTMIIEKLNVNSFIVAKTPTVYSILKDYKKANEKSPAKLKKLDNFKKILSGGQEFTALAGILKVNQKTAANLAELNKFFGKLENAMYSRENSVLEYSVADLRAFAIDIINPTYKKLNATDQELVDTIMLANNNFLDKDGNILENLQQHVIDTIIEANSIKVERTNYDGSKEIVNAAIAGGRFDFRHYIGEDSVEYKKITIKYYNLFKDTINIFDIIEESPHYKAMIDGVKITHNILNIVSKKYNFIFSDFRDYVRKNSGDIKSKNTNVEHILKNFSFPINIDDTIINKMLVYFDKMTVSKWLQAGQQALEYQFNATKLIRKLKDLGVEKSVLFYKGINAKQFSIGELRDRGSETATMIKEQGILVTADDTEDFMIDLFTDTGIANFKVLMENVIFEILKTSESSLSNSLIVSSVKNPYGFFASQIISKFPISNLNNPTNFEKFNELLNEFNEVDRKTHYKIENIKGKPLPYQDLFYLYNLMLNNESYGDKRLTPLFEDYVKSKRNLGNEFVHFYRKVDTRDIDLFKLEGEEELSKDDYNEQKQLQLNNILFMAFHDRGEFITPQKGDHMLLKNADYPINTEMNIVSSKNSAKYLLMQSVISTLKSQGLIINFNCI